MNENHPQIRETQTWGTYGKFGDEPLRFVLVKDITDDHLEHLIPYIERNILYYKEHIYQIMIDEREFRNKKHIRVPFVFGR